MLDFLPAWGLSKQTQSSHYIRLVLACSRAPQFSSVYFSVTAKCFTILCLCLWMPTHFRLVFSLRLSSVKVPQSYKYCGIRLLPDVGYIIWTVLFYILIITRNNLPGLYSRVNDVDALRYEQGQVFLLIERTNMSKITRELITLQVGHYANFVGTHWWNLQVSPDFESRFYDIITVLCTVKHLLFSAYSLSCMTTLVAFQIVNCLATSEVHLTWNSIFLWNTNVCIYTLFPHVSWGFGDAEPPLCKRLQ